DHRAGDNAAAERPELVRAHVRQGVQLTVDVEHADLDRTGLDDLLRARRQIAQRPDDVLSCHRYFAGTLILENRRSAFSPINFRLYSAGIGRSKTERGWSKSWCGQSDAKMVVSSPS